MERHTGTAAGIEDRIVKLVRQTVGGSADPTEDFVLLGEGGAVDSVAALELVLALEKEFGIVVSDDDIRPDNLRNVASITRFVLQALGRQS